MADFTRDELKALVAQSVPPCISLYTPLDHKGAVAYRNAVHLKELLQKAEKQLLAMNVKHTDADAILAPGRDFLDDKSFWDQQHEGLAVFMSAKPGSFRYYTDDSLAIKFVETAIVANRFYTKPLLPLFIGDAPFFVLTLSKEHVGLLRGTRDTIRAIAIPGVPHDIDEALGEEIPEREIQGRPMNMAGGQQVGVFGGFDPERYYKDRVLRYFRVVNASLHKMLANERAPLILAGMEYLHPLYREANTYPFLLDEGIMINAEDLPAKELHEKAWPIIEPAFQRDREAAVDRYRQLANTEQASHKLADILPAAHFARVATLFVADGQAQFGTFDPDTNKLEAHKEQQPGDDDLLDMAATDTVLNGGTVYIVPPDQMPDQRSAIAAVFRY